MQLSASSNRTHRRPRSQWSAFAYSLLLLLCAIASHQQVMAQGHKAYPPKMDPKPVLPDVTHKVYLEVEVDGTNIGKIVMGLFGKVAPKTVENFRALCACDQSDKTLCYKGSTFHRIIPNFMIQGGDIVRNDGTGGKSIYNNGGTFDDETFEVKFNRKFLLAMANGGKNTNASQFFITTAKTQWLTGKNVIFGQVMEESWKKVKTIEKEGTNSGIPRARSIVIVDSGELHLDGDDKKTNNNDHENKEDGDDREDAEEETE